jgi:hypothetical protein
MTTEYDEDADEVDSICHHHKSESRLKYDSKGDRHLVLQCVRCGKRMSKNISIKEFPQAQLDAIPKWDEGLQRNFYSTVSSGWFEHEESQESANQTGEDDYYLSQRWKDRCAKVMARAKMICEGCGVNPATRVHHLTCRRYGDEMLFDLVAVCEECGTKLHTPV